MYLLICLCILFTYSHTSIVYKKQYYKSIRYNASVYCSLDVGSSAFQAGVWGAWPRRGLHLSGHSESSGLRAQGV